jgi:peptidyl-prolyl cis-trans isomerase B (cyclophilin B)
MDTPAPPVNIPGTGKLMARFVTSAGNIECELHEALTPRTVANFVALATGTVAWRKPDGSQSNAPLYNNLVFHRVIPDFMIQGGCPQGTGTGGGPRQLKAEFTDARHVRGVLSAARAQDPNSASSQFFVMHADNPGLDGQYSAFGKLLMGYEVVDLIVNTPRDRTDRPGQRQVIESARVYRRKTS